MKKLLILQIKLRQLHIVEYLNSGKINYDKYIDPDSSDIELICKTMRTC